TSITGANLPHLYQIFNIGNGKPVDLLYFIGCLERYLGKPAQKQMHPMIPGDIVSTWADTNELERATGYSPRTDIDRGTRIFADWYKNYFIK
ncbi:NAD-dependent epimerase, partial [Dyadobacter sp. CY261]|nr:NAD-dependent epimerase [Dyadobacter sp. CY261]